MVKKTHTQGGILFALMTSPFIIDILDVKGRVYICFLIAIYMYGSYFGSVLPDVDMKSSYISKKIPIIYQLFGKHFKHRGFTHSIMCVLIMAVFVVSLNLLAKGDYAVKLFFYGVLVGYISHIILDLFTSDGVYLFAPYDKVIRLSNIKTNSKKEKKVKKILEIGTYIAVGANCYIVVVP